VNFSLATLPKGHFMRLASLMWERLAGWWRPAPLGRRGEDAAARFLRRLGYVILARRQRDKIGGELDIIAVDRRTVVFVEVKTRQSHDAGHPADAVDDKKQRRLTRLALAYLRRHDLLECSARFDVVAVTWASPREAPRIEHFKNAFEPVGKGQFFS
jgi:putative endonuclease